MYSRCDNDNKIPVPLEAEVIPVLDLTQLKTPEKLGNFSKRQPVSIPLTPLSLKSLTLSITFFHCRNQYPNSIPLTSIDPPSYYTNLQDIPHLDLAGTGPFQVGDTIKTLTSKSSTDLYGISIKLLKEVMAEIEAPLAHTFNFSLTTGCFPERLKASKVVPIHKAPTVTTTGL